MSRHRHKIFTTPLRAPKRIPSRDLEDLFGGRGQACARSALLLEVRVTAWVPARGDLGADPAAAHLRHRPHPGRQGRHGKKAGGEDLAKGKEGLALRAL